VKKIFIAVLFLCLLIPSVSFADAKGSADATVVPAGTDLILGIQGGVNKNFTPDGILSILGLTKGTYTNTYLCTYTTAGTLLNCNTNPASFQTALTYPVTGIAAPTAGYLTKWGASGNTLADGPKIGTFTDAKWCSYSTAGGLACTETAPAGSGDINAATATALAANPDDCGAGAMATAIAANGNLTCSASWAAPSAIGSGTPAAGTFTTLNAGGTGFSVDADGDVIVKSVTATRTATGGVRTLYEGTGGGDNFRSESVPDALAADLNLRHADALPTVDQFQLYPAPSAGVSAYTWTTYGASKTPVIDDPDNFAANFTGSNLYGGTFITNAAGTAALPDATAGMNFTIVLEGTGATVLEPLATGTDDTIVLNGTALTQGHNITSSTSGAMCVFQYRAANSWMATCNGFVDGT